MDEADRQWDFLKRITRPALVVAPSSFLDDIRANLEMFGVQDAVARGDSAASSPPITNTIGIEEVAFFAASAEFEPPTATRTATGSRTSSAASSGGFSSRPAAQR
jgi:hypothetical protein